MNRLANETRKKFSFAWSKFAKREELERSVWDRLCG